MERNEHKLVYLSYGQKIRFKSGAYNIHVYTTYNMHMCNMYATVPIKSENMCGSKRKYDVDPKLHLRRPIGAQTPLTMPSLPRECEASRGRKRFILSSGGRDAIMPN
jgi:hypothetical protein